MSSAKLVSHKLSSWAGAKEIGCTQTMTVAETRLLVGSVVLICSGSYLDISANLPYLAVAVEA